MAPYVMYEIDTAMNLVVYQYLAWDKLSVKTTKYKQQKENYNFCSITHVYTHFTADKTP